MKQNYLDDIRFNSREMVRELGFLANPYQALGLNFAKVHLLLECTQQDITSQHVLVKNLRLNKSYISRLVSELEKRGLLETSDCVADNRVKNISLTSKGQALIKEINAAAQQQVLAALHYLTEPEIALIKQGLTIYANALKKSRRLQDIVIRPIEKRDNAALSTLIKEVLREFGANKPGFAFCDEELNAMYEAYQVQGSAYFVAEKAGKLLGGVGIGQLLGADKTICELKKMYLISSARDLGLGDELLKQGLSAALEKNYQKVYLETSSMMAQAIVFYRRHGFEFLNAPLGNTGHFSCDTWMQKSVT